MEKLCEVKALRLRILYLPTGCFCVGVVGHWKILDKTILHLHVSKFACSTNVQFGMSVHVACNRVYTCTIVPGELGDALGRNTKRC